MELKSKRRKNGKDKIIRRKEMIGLKSLKPFFLFLGALSFFSFVFTLFSLQIQAKPLAAEEAAEVLKKVAPSVVKVEVADGLRRVATGVVIDRDGSIMTTALISPRKERITIKTHDGQTCEASYIGFDPLTRLALLQVKDKGLQPIARAQSQDVSPGEWIAVVSVSPEDTPAITQGIISSISEDRIRLNISVLPGASGSPVVNRRGEMIGLLRGPYAERGPVIFEFRERDVVGSGYVISRGEAPASGLALAIPVDLVKKVADELKEKGRIERGWLGISLEEDSKGKVRITLVEKNSPAQQAGLKLGDIILKIDGRKVINGEYLAREIRNRRPGQEVILEIERNGKIREIKVKLGAYPQEEAERELERFLPEFLRPMPFLSPDFPERFRFFERRRYIGIYPEEIGPSLAEYFGVKDGKGILVTQLDPNSPAEKGGIKVGDVIIRADGRRIETIDELNSIIQKKRKGEKVKLELVRDKKTIELEIEIAEEERGFGFSSHDWNRIFQDFKRRSQELQEIFKHSQEERSLRTRQNWRRINVEIDYLKKEYDLRLKELQRKLKEWKEKTKDVFHTRYILC